MSTVLPRFAPIFSHIVPGPRLSHEAPFPSHQFQRAAVVAAEKRASKSK